jgi:hypothetical protein
MKNLYYGLLVLGVIALAACAYLFATATAAAPHHLSKYAALVAGVILLAVGIYGAFVAKPKAIAK